MKKLKKLNNKRSTEKRSQWYDVLRVVGLFFGLLTFFLGMINILSK